MRKRDYSDYLQDIMDSIMENHPTRFASIKNPCFKGCGGVERREINWSPLTTHWKPESICKESYFNV